MVQWKQNTDTYEAVSYTHLDVYKRQHLLIQVHRITDLIERLLEEKKICTPIFLDVAQASDKVWHVSLQMSQVFKSYILE